jgi:predicted dehydrogenase
LSSKPLNLAIVGLGYWGPTLLRALVEVEGVEVGWLCDSDRSRLERSRRRYPAARATTRIDDLLADPKLDAVVLATPVFTHFYLASRALTAGKHVFVEKPLATSSAEADQLARLAEMEGRVLMCGHTFIYSPPVRAVKELLDKDALGQIYFVSSSRVNLGLHQSDISVVWDLGPHDFSILLYWFEEMPTTIRAVGRDSVVKGITDVAFVTMDFPSGILANVELSWLAPSKLRRTVIVGSEKMVVYDDVSADAKITVYDRGVTKKLLEEGQEPAGYRTYGEFQLLLRAGDVLIPKLDFTEPLKIECQHFVDCIRSGEAPRSDGRAGLRVVRALEAAQRSMTAG